MFPLPGARLRPPRATDAEAIARHLDDVEVWRNLRDRVPHPYTSADARRFLTMRPDDGSETWIVEVGGEACGAIGLHPRTDVHRHVAELGYWIGRRYWGRGLATAAVRAVVPHAFATRSDLARLQAEVFGWNAASARVLEKCGFVLEGRLRDAVRKLGATTDLLVYGLLRGGS